MSESTLNDIEHSIQIAYKDSSPAEIKTEMAEEITTVEKWKHKADMLDDIVGGYYTNWTDEETVEDVSRAAAKVKDGYGEYGTEY